MALFKTAKQQLFRRLIIAFIFYPVAQPRSTRATKGVDSHPMSLFVTANLVSWIDVIREPQKHRNSSLRNVSESIPLVSNGKYSRPCASRTHAKTREKRDENVFS